MILSDRGIEQAIRSGHIRIDPQVDPSQSMLPENRIDPGFVRCGRPCPSSTTSSNPNWT
jgi:hypothetical protein